MLIPLKLVQDCELHVLRADIERLAAEKQTQSDQINKLQSELQITKDQHALLKAKISSNIDFHSFADP